MNGDIILTLRHRRVQLGITQQEIADTLGKSKKTVIRWEQRQNDPTLADLAAWSEAVGFKLAAIPMDDGSLDLPSNAPYASTPPPSGKGENR